MVESYMSTPVAFALGAILVTTIAIFLPKSISTPIMSMMGRAPPTAPDGKTDQNAAAMPTAEKTSVLYDLTHLGGKNTKTMVQAFKTLASGEPMNDKELLLENGVSMLQTLPPNSGLGTTVANGFVKMLWQDLPHPPGTLAGPEARYRRHDGGANTPWAPEMGKAGSEYCRSVPALKPRGPNLPDPELVYEHLLKRKGPFRPHPSGLNRMFFSFATIVIHECFQTNRKEQWKNETSSYVDLSTLYGNTEKEQVRVRAKKNGLIFPDSVASERIMLMPTGVVACLIMFSRNHNHIAETLLSVNEFGRYGKWDELDPEKQAWQDNDIFQLARNINVGFFASVVMKDYVAAILNTPRADSTWSLDLGGEIKSGASRVERGSGNVVSVEFAVLYHWHAALSQADADWMEQLLKWNLPEVKSLDDMTVGLFHKVLVQEATKLMSKPAKEWTFDHYKRGPDGRFSDVDLGNILKDCVEEPAHAFGAHGTPASLKYVDVLGQIQAREMFNVCTMNEFRKYLNLKPYESFEEWCEDKETARAAELLYGHIENLELYPGLQAECTKPAMPGSGVCPGQTTGRGILDDAVSLVRGDRFLSYDFNSSTLTNWGWSKLNTPILGSYGGMLPYLIFTGLPSEFTGTSSYGLLPFYTPTAAKGILKGNGVLEKYDVNRPKADRHVVAIRSSDGCKKVFDDRASFPTMSHAPAQISALNKVFFEPNFEASVTRFFREHVRSLIKKSSLAYPGPQRTVDIVRDVCNIAPLLWLAERFAIPVKSHEHPRGLITLPELFEMYLDLYMYQNANVLPVHEWKLREGATKAGPVITKIFEAHLKTQRGIHEGVVDWLAKGSAFEVKGDADRLYHALNDTKLPVSQLAGECVSTGAPIAAIMTQQASVLVDLFLTEGYEPYKKRIVELANRDDAAADRELEGFVLEGMRHASVVPGIPRVAARDTTVQDGPNGSVHIKAGQTVLIATSSAAMDPVAFSSPEKLDPSRSRASYALLDQGVHSAFGTRLAAPALAATLKEIFKLKNVRRAPGRAGHFSLLHNDLGGVKSKVYLDGHSKESPFPTTLSIHYDEY